jgi:fatty acid desaturase
METVATHSISRGLLRHSRWDAVLIGLSLLHPVAMFLVPSMPVIAIGLWWNSNTISHNFIHLPFFRSSRWNRAYSLFLSLLLGFPQTVWRDRHLAHHAGHPGRLRFSAAIAIELGAVLALWGLLLYTVPDFFLFVYLPGYGLGLCLCFLHGYFEHAEGTTSHYGFVNNVLFFNDGYHVEHHRLPGEHWTRLPGYVRPGARSSSWPAVFRWIEYISIESLERIALRSRLLQRFLLKSHERAIRNLLPEVSRVHSIRVIGGGMFPRSAIVLRKMLPDAAITIVDANAAHIETAESFLPERVDSEVRLFDPAVPEDADLIVIPLSFIGDRRVIYRNPPARQVLVHDWIWSRQGSSEIVSLLLLKRINLVSRSD